MGTDFDAYRILEVDPSAGQDEIDAAFRRLVAAKIGGGADPAILEIETAYRLLSNPDERRAYDERRAAGPVAIDTEIESGPTKVPWTVRDMAFALILPLAIFGLNIAAGFLTDVDEDELTATDYSVSFAFTLVLEVVLIGLAYFFSIRKYKLGWGALGFAKPQGVKWWFPFAILGTALLLIWGYSAVLILIDVEPESNVPSEAYDNIVPLVLLGIVTVMAAPIGEEIFFRGFLFQGIASRRGVYAGIAVSALLFGLAHVSTPESLLIAPPIAVIGGIFAWSVAKSRSILPAVAAHLLFNAVSVVAGAFA